MTASEKKHSPEIERALTRQNASFAVRTADDLAHLIHMARCAAERLEPLPQEARDVLAALCLALERGDASALTELAKPALKQITAAHAEAERQLQSGELAGAWPTGFDASQPQFRAHGGKTTFGRLLLEIASIYPRGAGRNDNEGERGRALAEDFASTVSLLAAQGPYIDVDREALKRRVLEMFPQGPTDDLESDAVGIGEALGMSRKDARNAVDQAASDFGSK